MLLQGRPFGGCAILYRQNPSNKLRHHLIILVDTYLPTDYRSATATGQLKDTLGDLCGFISTISHDCLIIGNTDTQHPCHFTDSVSVNLTCLLLISISLMILVSHIWVMMGPSLGLVMSFTIPSSDPGRRPRVTGWSQFVKPESAASQWLWLEAGSPFSAKKKHAHRRYKYAVRRVRRKEEHLKRTRMTEALLNDPNSNFWSEVYSVRRFSKNHTSAPAPVIDGVSGSDNTANLWCNSFT